MVPRKLIPLSKSWTRGTPIRHYLRGPCRFAQIQLKGRTERQLQSLYRAIENVLNEWMTEEVSADNGTVILPWGPINERPIDALDIISHCLADKRPRFEKLVAKHSLANIYAVLVLKSAASVPGYGLSDVVPDEMMRCGPQARLALRASFRLAAERIIALAKFQEEGAKSQMGNISTLARALLDHKENERRGTSAEMRRRVNKRYKPAHALMERVFRLYQSRKWQSKAEAAKVIYTDLLTPEDKNTWMGTHQMVSRSFIAG